MEMKSIDNYGNYFITTDGRVWSQKSNKYLKAGLNVPGYKFVFICQNGTKTILAVHRLVALAFIPNVENKPFVNHKDGNKLNNLVDNLEWVTRQENMNHASKNGLLVSGSFHPGAKKVIDSNTGKIYNTLKEAAIDFGFKRSTLGKMLNGINSNRTTLNYL